MIVDKLATLFKEPIDIYSAIFPLFNLCTIFGLAPYSLKRQENGQKHFKFAWLPLLRNVILVVLLVSGLLYHAIYDLSFYKDIELKQKLRYFQEIFSSLLSCFAVIFGGIFALKIIEVFKNVGEVDVAFRSLAVWVPYKNIYVYIIIHLSTLIIIILLLIFDVIYFASQLYGSQNYSLFITFITIIFPYFINLLMELQYCHYLNILRIRYKLLNEYLETLVQEPPPYQVIDGWTDGEIKATPSSISHKSSGEKFSSGNKIPKSMMAISDPVYVVDQVAALHIKLTDTAHMINYAFCVQQLLRITVAFISIVTALFLIAINFSKASQQDDGKAGLDYFFTFWAFSNACEVMGIVWITSETCEEANTCPRILHKIRNNTNNVNLQDTIEIYSLQMYHNRLSFTVCGLFPLDYTLLYTIVAGVTTYLVILIQFNNADFIKNTNSNFTNSTYNFTQ